MAAKPKKFKYDAKSINKAEILVCQKKFDLNQDQQMLIKEKYTEYSSLLDLTKEVFQDQSLVEDSDELKNVKNFIIRLRSGQEVVNFTEEQLTFIEQNGETMRAMDIARLLFPEIEGNPMKECRSIVTVLAAMGITYQGEGGDKEEPAGPYIPPPSDHKVISLINRAEPSLKYHISALDSDKKKKIAIIKHALNSPRIIAMISAIRSKIHREVFETQFIMYLIDKVDPVAEDISTIANLANENVRSLLITEELAMLNDRLAESNMDDENNKKFTQALATAVTSKASEYNSCQARMMKLHSDLVQSRADRFKHMGAMKESLAQFIELSKSERGREYLIRLTELREGELKKESARIESLADLVAEIRGVSIEELLNFK